MEGAADCHLLGFLGIGVQLAITLVCAGAMLTIWATEIPRRPFLTWAFDMSKQVAGAAYGKCCNIMQAEVFAHHLRDDADMQDQCVWYLMGIATDCLVTTFLCCGVNSFLRPLLLEHCGVDVGDYKEVPVVPTPSGTFRMLSPTDLYRKLPEAPSTSRSCSSTASERVRMWLLQVAIWLTIISGVRLAVSAMLLLTQATAYNFYATVFRGLGLECPAAKMLFAGLVFPAFGDTLQIVVQDHFLKKRAQSSVEEALQLPRSVQPF